MQATSAHSPETRERLLTALRELIRDRPIESVSLTEIARASGLSRPTVARHLGSRADLRRWLTEQLPEHAQAHPGARERLLSLALAHWGAGQGGAPSLEALALLAGLNKGSVYWHFHTKTDLLFGVAEQLCAVYATRGLFTAGDSAHAAAESVPLRLHAGLQLLLERRIALAREYPRAGAALSWLKQAGPEPAQSHVLSAERGFRRGTKRWLGALGRRGELRAGCDAEALIATLEALMLSGEQRVGQHAWAGRLAALLADAVQR